MTNKRNSILAAGAVAAALSGQAAHAGESIKPIQNKTRALTGDLIVLQNDDSASLAIGGVNHGSENGVSAQVVIPAETTAYAAAVDKSDTQFHAIIGSGKSFENGYIYKTTSYARENHFGKDLTAKGGSIGGAYIGNGVAVDGSIIVHKADNAHIDSRMDENVSSSVDVAGNIKTTTTTHTKTTTNRDFDGQTRGYANFGATFDVGQNGELRVGAQHEFGMNDRTSANIQYNQLFNHDRSKWYIAANTDKRYEAGVQHAFKDSNWSMNAGVFSEKGVNNTQNNGGFMGVTYRPGSKSAPSLRTTTRGNANAIMNNALRNAVHTSSPHAVKNIHTLGEIKTTQTVEQSSSQKIEKLDTLSVFRAPTVEVTGNTLIVTDHGISDADGVENVEYILRTVGGTEIKNKTGVFEKLIDGTYTIVTVADVKDGSTGQLVTKENPNRATVEVKNVQTMTQAEFDEIISRLPTDLDDGYVHKDFVFDFNKYLQNDDIEIIDIQLTEIYGHNNLKGKVDLKNNVLRISNEGVFGEKYIVSIMFGSKTNKELRRSHSFETYFLMGK